MAEKEVYFYEYCQKCKFRNKEEYEEPCDECLDMPYNEDSHKPICFKES